MINKKQFYLMDESMQVRILQIDEKLQKFKEVGMRDMPAIVKENWSHRE